MSYTLSFDVSPEGKVTKNSLRGYLHHQARDIDKKNGTEVRHSNEQIQPERTGKNRTWVKVKKGDKLTWGQPKNIEQIQARVDRRLQAVTGRMRKDSVVVRGIVVQLDPAWYADHPGKTPVNDIYQWAAKTFGAKNIVAIFEHNDESNPHYHLAFTPVTEDGRLSQKDFLGGPAQLRAMHDDFRAFMTERGYDIQMERLPKKKHMKDSEYKRLKDAEKKAAELEAREGAVEARERALSEQEARIRVDSEKARRAVQEAEERAKELAVDDKTTLVGLLDLMDKIIARLRAVRPRSRTLDDFIRRAEERADQANHFFAEHPELGDKTLGELER